jgi:hypothetical protein
MQIPIEQRGLVERDDAVAIGNERGAAKRRHLH